MNRTFNTTTAQVDSSPQTKNYRDQTDALEIISVISFCLFFPGELSQIPSTVTSKAFGLSVVTKYRASTYLQGPFDRSFTNDALQFTVENLATAECLASSW